MVEITASLVLQVVQTIALIVGIAYYIMTLQNTRKNQQMTLESTQLRTLANFSDNYTEADAMRGAELMNMEWEDYDDYERKYGSDFNLDNYSKRMVNWGRYNTMGILLRRGLIERDLLFEYAQHAPIQHWTKFKDVIYEMRRRYNVPLFGVDFEYLADECRKYVEEKGFDPKVPDTFFRYVPDE